MTTPATIPTLAFETAETFETWLEKNQDHSNGLWLKIFKKDSGKKTINYAEALDVALCYGWIDGQKKSFDELAYLQKFCPRRDKSIWSKINIGHVERLIEAGRMKPAGCFRFSFSLTFMQFSFMLISVFVTPATINRRSRRRTAVYSHRLSAKT